MYLDEKDLNSFFGTEEKGKTGPMKNFYYPLSFAVNPEFFSALKKSFKDTRISDLHKIYKAYRSGMSIKEMQENGYIDPNIKVKDPNDFVSVVQANLRGEVRQTPWGKMEVVSLYNEEFDQDYLDFVRDIHIGEMSKKEAVKWDDAKQYEKVDPKSIPNLFGDIEKKHLKTNTIKTEVE